MAAWIAQNGLTVWKLEPFEVFRKIDTFWAEISHCDAVSINQVDCGAVSPWAAKKRDFNPKTTHQTSELVHETLTQPYTSINKHIGPVFTQTHFPNRYLPLMNLLVKFWTKNKLSSYITSSPQRSISIIYRYDPYLRWKEFKNTYNDSWKIWNPSRKWYGYEENSITIIIL